MVSKNHNDEVAILKDCLIRFMAMAEMYDKEAVKDVYGYIMTQISEIRGEPHELKFFEAALQYLEACVDD